MRNVSMAGILAVLVLGWAGTSQAQDTRLAAFALHCFVPITSDMHTRAVLVGKITLANRTDWFVVSCYDGPSASRFPDILVSDGEVQAIDVSTVAVPEDSTQQVIAYNSCDAHGKNGFLTFRCMSTTSCGGRSSPTWVLAHAEYRQAKALCKTSVMRCRSLNGMTTLEQITWVTVN